MAVFTLRRLLQVIPTLWIIATLTFILMKLTPGGPFDDEKSVSPEVKALIEAHYGLDQPVYIQYVRFIWQRLQGDLGPLTSMLAGTLMKSLRTVFRFRWNWGFMH